MTNKFTKDDLLTKLAVFYATDKAQHGFSHFYDHYLGPYRNSFNSVAEIGIHTGSSLLM